MLFWKFQFYSQITRTEKSNQKIKTKYSSSKHSNTLAIQEIFQLNYAGLWIWPLPLWLPRDYEGIVLKPLLLRNAQCHAIWTKWKRMGEQNWYAVLDLINFFFIIVKSKFFRCSEAQKSKEQYLIGRLNRRHIIKLRSTEETAFLD